MIDEILSPRRYPTKEETIYQVLREAILKCQIVPGEKLVVDHLSEKLGVSTIPVRTALQRLQAEGLVEITPHAGAVVAEISPEMVSELFVLLEALEKAAFELAAARVKPDNITALRQIIERMEDASQRGDDEIYSELNQQLHLSIAQISGMKLLVEFTGRTLDSWRRLRRYYRDRLDYSQGVYHLADHRCMVDLLSQGDAAKLIELAARHNREAMRVYREMMGKAKE